MTESGMTIWLVLTGAAAAVLDGAIIAAEVVAMTMAVGAMADVDTDLGALESN